MRYIKAFAFFAVIFILQPMFAAMIPLLELPNLILCFTFMSLLLGKEDEQVQIVLAGAFFTLMSDICYTQYLGGELLAYVVFVFVVITGKHYINSENKLMVIIAICASSLLYNMVYWGITLLLGSPYGFLYLIKYVFAYMLADLAVCLCIYFVCMGRIIQDRRDRYFR